MINSYIKLKKPIRYTFLDFSTLGSRKYFCEREIQLNRRLTDNVYLDVQPIYEWEGKFIIGREGGAPIDYAVRMWKVDKGKQMDTLLLENKVTEADIRKLAEKIAFFHKNTEIIYKKNFLDIQEKFNDLEAESGFLAEQIGISCSNIITRAIETSDIFMSKNKALLARRVNDGFFRDCHGDLHSRNIFLLSSPQPFDCIEFNDDFRQIDVLNEVAFLCMDLDAFGRQDLAGSFVNYYNHIFPAIVRDEDYRLFIYYKSYRANIRAKVNSLRARSSMDDGSRIKALAAAEKYLLLMDSYIRSPELLQ